MTCELASNCPYFGAGMKAKPQTAAMFRARYCRGHQSQCARYEVYELLGRDAVPVELAPNEHLRAMMIMRASHAAACDTPH